ARIVQETHGGADTATDAEIVDGIRLLARTEGIFTETAGGVTTAVLKKLARTGIISSDELVVAYITGNGFKTIEAVAGRTSPMHEINPRLEEFRELFERVTATPVRP
ncbi:MAG TPA: pyridoxal-phosphate dependent enzyme, partial [Elusimicrobiota bacterium]|nr:pyridoxal-phosphate dependent enzyme [Elusimicrobiota bacterium]